ncbi:MAG: hypothetical protein M0C28_44050 [Candidatus Moduliflexus flocculans]|nr:hypothetical protein [Candidatus Moduliflexus flocculans]
MHLEQYAIPPREYIPDIPPALEEIVLKVLSRNPLRVTAPPTSSGASFCASGPSAARRPPRRLSA